MHGILQVTLIVAISLYVQVDTRGYDVFHPPQPWVLSRRTLYDPSQSSSEDKVSENTPHPTQPRPVQEGDDSYLSYTTASQESPIEREYRGETAPLEETDSSEHQINQRQRNRYRDEPIEDDVELDEDSYTPNEYREPSQYDLANHSPYDQYEGDGDNEDGYEDDDTNYDETANSALQLETNAEPYDDEVAAKEENNAQNEPETYSLENPAPQVGDNKENNANNESGSSSETNANNDDENNSQSKADDGDDGSDEDEDDDTYDDDDDDYDYEDDDEDDTYDDKGGKGKGKKNRDDDDKKKVTAPFWGAHDHALGNTKGEGFAVQGPPVYFEDGEPQWPPESYGGRGRGGKGKGGKGGKDKKKGKKGKGKKGGGKKSPGWGWNHGWGGWERIGNGGWGEWPKGWISSTNLDTGDQRWVEGKGWVGETGAPWIPKREFIHHWGHPLGWGKMEELGRGGKKGKGGKGGKKGKGKGKGKKGKGKKKKKKCKKRKGRGGGKGKKNKKGRGCDEDSGWGWPRPHFLKLKPLPPRGSQVYLNKGGWPAKPVGGWHPSRGWDILRKVTGGWVLPDLVGVVNLNG